MLSSIVQRKWPVIVILLSVTILISAVPRLYDLDRRTMTHIEIYAPGIELPAGLSIPAPRLTLRQTLSGLLAYEEPHPPGYYIFMLGWTKLLGSGVLALRLPSVIFGVACIPSLYVLGARERDPTSALLAAGMLAINGYHVLWSQLAKMYILACLLGLLSTLFLMLSLEERTRDRQLKFQFLYLGTTLFGLATSHYFWLILATHMLWIVIRSANEPTMPGILRVQFVTILLGSPLFSLALFQSRRPSYLGTEILKSLSQFFQFGFLFVPDWNSDPWGPVRNIGAVLLTLTGLLLLGLGLSPNEKKEGRENITTAIGPWSVVTAPAALLAFLFILRLALFTHNYDTHYAKLVAASSVVPVLVAFSYFVITRNWRYLQPFGAYLKERITSPLPARLSLLLALLPVAMLVLISPFVNLVTSRSMLLFVPFLLLILARGLVTLANRTRYWVVLAAILVAVHALSIAYYKVNFHQRPTDYKALAEQWVPEIEDSDLIFVQKHWVTTPIFFYLEGDQYNFVGNDYAEATEKHPDARVWVMSFEGLPMASQMETALQDYQIEGQFEARRVSAILYDRGSATE